jgi:hypothetical protein
LNRIVLFTDLTYNFNTHFFNKNNNKTYSMQPLRCNRSFGWLFIFI